MGDLTALFNLSITENGTPNTMYLMIQSNKKYIFPSRNVYHFKKTPELESHQTSSFNR